MHAKAIAHKCKLRAGQTAANGGRSGNQRDLELSSPPPLTTVLEVQIVLLSALPQLVNFCLEVMRETLRVGEGEAARNKLDSQ